MSEPEDMVRRVCARMGVKRALLLKGRRTSNIVDARSVAAYALRARFGLSFPAMAPFLGCRDHTSALYHFGRAQSDWRLGETARRVLVEESARDPEEVMP